VGSKKALIGSLGALRGEAIGPMHETNRTLCSGSDLGKVRRSQAHVPCFWCEQCEPLVLSWMESLGWNCYAAVQPRVAHLYLVECFVTRGGRGSPPLCVALRLPPVFRLGIFLVCLDSIGPLGPLRGEAIGPMHEANRALCSGSGSGKVRRSQAQSPCLWCRRCEPLVLSWVESPGQNHCKMKTSVRWTYARFLIFIS